MDAFKSAMTKICAVGGMKCACCNFSHETDRKTKRILRQIARASLKRELLGAAKHIEEEL